MLIDQCVGWAAPTASRECARDDKLRDTHPMGRALESASSELRDPQN
jgi:hypothetical protein